mgnify:CR=1 FL=1
MESAEWVVIGVRIGEYRGNWGVMQEGDSGVQIEEWCGNDAQKASKR